MKQFQVRDFANFQKRHETFSGLCEKYDITPDDLERAIKNVFHPTKAREIIREFKSNDKQAQKKEAKHHENTQEDKMKKQTEKKSSNASVDVENHIILVDGELTEDVVDEIISTVDEINAKNEATELELLHEKASSLDEKISEAKQKLEKLYGMKAEASKEANRLTAEIQALKDSIDQKIGQVVELKDFCHDIDNQISSAEANAKKLNDELLQTQAAIKVAEVINVTVADGVVRVEADASIPMPTNIEVSADEMATVSMQFASDEAYQDLKFKDIRCLIELNKFMQAVHKDYNNIENNIEIKFENSLLESAWKANRDNI